MESELRVGIIIPYVKTVPTHVMINVLFIEIDPKREKPVSLFSKCIIQGGTSHGILNFIFYIHKLNLIIKMKKHMIVSLNKPNIINNSKVPFPYYPLLLKIKDGYRLQIESQENV